MLRKNVFGFLGVAVLISVAILSFEFGQMYNQFIYLDICLDMGGGRNPGGHQICVIEKMPQDQR